MTIIKTACAALALIGAAACTPREELPPQYAPSTAITTVPPQRSYLDPGPAQSTGGPRYLQRGAGSPPRQTDMFGNDLVPGL